MIRLKALLFTFAVTMSLMGNASQTNVLLIIADDLGIDSLAAFNSDSSASLPPTPTIDTIQSNGIAFTRFYAYSTCSPTRASIMTGRYSFRTGVLSPQVNRLQANEFTLPEALLESGVISNRLAHIGKWHLGSDADSPNIIGGWPHFSGGLGGGIGDYYNWSKTVNGNTTNNYTVYGTTDNVNDSIAWINQQGTDSWFLWLAFNAPHSPFQRPPNNLHDYDTITDEGNSRSHYESMVQALDTEIARLLTNVDLSVTTIIFMGDNGTPGRMGQPPFPSGHNKGSIYEGGIRVPLLVYGAAVSNSMAGTAYDGPVHACDLYATILELFGVDMTDLVPEELVFDSHSFASVLRGEPYMRTPADIMVQNDSNRTGGRSIMEGGYKYIAFTNGTEAFYNVTLDLPETNNLLSGTLTAPEQTILNSLQNRITVYSNVPHIYSAYIDGDGMFDTQIGWFDNDGFTLWRSGNLVSSEWTAVTGQEVIDNGAPTLVLRDPSPPSSNAFYRVTTP